MGNYASLFAFWTPLRVQSWLFHPCNLLVTVMLPLQNSVRRTIISRSKLGPPKSDTSTCCLQRTKRVLPTVCLWMCVSTVFQLYLSAFCLCDTNLQVPLFKLEEHHKPYISRGMSYSTLSSSDLTLTRFDVQYGIPSYSFPYQLKHLIHKKVFHCLLSYKGNLNFI